ncbi:polysaccharide biosynthesis/export family protein [Caulobacter soli]|uniref:polysaccharide biosynthesis/export family protein n=1 Tax=Caulobacter soli TaxID=2708539 RepID=UPI0013ECCE1E|nr:polysaccharide biosynthesis/export family protein [Caulobacter soli]
MISSSRSWTRIAGFLSLAPMLAVLGACASLPSSGPTADAIGAAQRQSGDFSIVDIDAAAVASLSSAAAGPASLVGRGADGSADLLGPGDVLDISIYEVGVGLFGARSTSVSGTGALAPPTGAAETLPPITVGRDGAIALPWIGRLTAAGKTPDVLAAEIARALRGKSQDPQVVVGVRENLANTVMVTGDVKKPGRVPLSLAGERLSDAVALVGGPSYAVQDSTVQLGRDGHGATIPLAALVAGSPDDVPLRGGDRVTVTFQPRSFTVFGAAGKVSEVAFQSPRVSLAEAIARAGGPSDQQADASAVFVFRYQPSATDGAPMAGARPVAYRLDLLKARSYFLAQGFEMRPRDVIYIANARSNQPTKIAQILNLFFSPIYTAKVLTR